MSSWLYIIWHKNIWHNYESCSDSTLFVVSSTWCVGRKDWLSFSHELDVGNPAFIAQKLKLGTFINCTGLHFSINRSLAITRIPTISVIIIIVGWCNNRECIPKCRYIKTNLKTLVVFSPVFSWSFSYLCRAFHPSLASLSSRPALRAPP